MAYTKQNFTNDMVLEADHLNHMEEQIASNESENNELLIGFASVSSLVRDKADKDHTHNYASINHSHEGVYAAESHKHDNDYAAKTHTHTEYASASHDHDYAAKVHEHGVADVKYPRLTDAQKTQLQALIDDYIAMKQSLFFYTGAVRRESYATAAVIEKLGYSQDIQEGCVYKFTDSVLDEKIFGTTTAGKAKWGNPYYKYMLNCGMFCQMVWMGRPITDFIQSGYGKSLTGADSNDLLYYVNNNGTDTSLTAPNHHAPQTKPTISKTINSVFNVDGTPWGYYFDFDLAKRAYKATTGNGGYYKYNSYYKTKTSADITVSGGSGTGYTSVKENTGKAIAYSVTNQVLINSQFIITLNSGSTISANKEIHVGTIESTYKPANKTPIAAYHSEGRCYGRIDTDGKIYVYCTTALAEGKNYIWINTTYVPATDVDLGESIALGFDGASHMAEELYAMGCEVPYSEIDTGDLVFFRIGDVSDDLRNKPTSDDDDAMLSRAYRNISHVGVVYGFDDSGYPIIADCTNGYAEPIVIGKTSLGSTTVFARCKAVNERNHLVMVARHPAAFGLGGNVPTSFSKYRGQNLGT